MNATDLKNANFIKIWKFCTKAKNAKNLKIARNSKKAKKAELQNF